jgi:hypothetical protein
MGPVIDALPRNTHLRSLGYSLDFAGDAFAASAAAATGCARQHVAAASIGARASHAAVAVRGAAAGPQARHGGQGLARGLLRGRRRACFSRNACRRRVCPSSACVLHCVSSTNRARKLHDPRLDPRVTRPQLFPAIHYNCAQNASHRQVLATTTRPHTAHAWRRCATVWRAASASVAARLHRPKHTLCKRNVLSTGVSVAGAAQCTHGHARCTGVQQPQQDCTAQARVPGSSAAARDAATQRAGGVRVRWWWC